MTDTPSQEVISVLFNVFATTFGVTSSFLNTWKMTAVTPLYKQLLSIQMQKKF